MKYESLDDKVILSEYTSFDIEQTLECGQCFRFTKLGEKEYVIIALGKVLHIKQQGNLTEFYPCSLQEFETIWLHYFDLTTDYDHIKNILSADPVLEKAIAYGSGIRILNQDIWECLMSFMVSQNMTIARIKQIVKTIAERYGDPIGDYYAFPTVQQLKRVTEAELLDCKAGFRAKYLKEAIYKVSSNIIKLDTFEQKPTLEIKKELMAIFGVGEKVADCVLLFSCQRGEAFPIDVWIKRVVQDAYFEGKEINLRELRQFARDKYGEHAGIAQQYLFYFGRNQ